MKSLLRFAPLAFAILAGCATDVSLGVTEEDLSKDDLTRDGYKCTQTAPLGRTWRCTKCVTTTVTDSTGTHTFQNCWSVGCDGYPDGHTECDAQSLAVPSVWLEAEQTTLYGSMQVVTDYGASAAKALSVAGPGSTRATFSMDAGAAITPWVRVMAPSTAANSVYVQIDSQPLVRWEIPVTTSWQWLQVPATFSVGAGSHYLRFYADEYGVKLDRVVLSGEAGFVPVVKTIQAESAAVVAPMQIVSGKLGGTGYAWVPNGAGAGGLAQLQLSMPYNDYYYVWGRMLAPTEADNSFYVGKLGEPRTAWSAPVSTSWKWSVAPTTMWLDDYDVVEVAQREDGTKLDQLVFTNDPGLTLVEPVDQSVLAP